MFSIDKKRNRINKNFKNQIQKSHLQFVSKEVSGRRSAASEKQHRTVLFYPIDDKSVLSLVGKNATVYLCSTFLHSDAQCNKSNYAIPDFPMYKYQTCTENFVKSYVNGHVDSYEYDDDCNSVLFYKTFDNFELRILSHILIEYFDDLVKKTTLRIRNGNRHLNIVHKLAPDFKPINLSDCLLRLHTYLEMQQKTQVDKLSIMQSLTISVAERKETGRGRCKYPHNVEISFKISLNNLLPIVETDIASFEKAFLDVIKKKLVEN